MVQLLRSQRTSRVRARFTTPPAIGTAPAIVGQVLTTAPIVYTPASGITGAPTPTVTHDLWKNGALFVRNYVSGTYTPPINRDTYFMRATADAGAYGLVTADSPTLTSTTIVMATITGAAVAGKPLYFSLPSGSAAVTGVQWYRNAGAGAGPTAVAGATALPIASVPADMGFPSVRGTLADGSIFTSVEFTTPGAIITRGPVVNGTESAAFQTSWTTPTANATLYTWATARVKDFGSAQGPNYYIDNVYAPGSYTASDAAYNYQALLNVTGGSQFSTSINLIQCGTPTTVIPAAAPPATATRPAGNTGNGFFVAANGSIYDPNGKLFLPWGTNKLHNDLTTPGLVNSGANTVRAWLDFSLGHANNTDLIDNFTANGICTIACQSFGFSNFTATFSGNQMTVTAMSAQPAGGYIFAGEAVTINDSTTGFVASKILYQVSGTPGGVGVYALSQNQTIAGPALMRQLQGTTSELIPSVGCITSAVQGVLNQASVLNARSKYIMVNPGNEWGPPYVSNIFAAGAGYVDGSYTNVALTGGTGTGKTANIVVSGGQVVSLIISAYGTGYTTGDSLSAAASSLGGSGSGFVYNLQGNLQSGGSGYTNGTYTNVSLLGGSGSGKIATVVVASGAVTTVTETTTGSGYINGDILTAAPGVLGGTGSGFQYRVGAGNTLWRDTWITLVPKIRAAGITCPIVIDLPGSGQDNGNCASLLAGAAAIAATDTFKNIIFAPHCYGAYRPGSFAGVASALRTQLMSQGIGIIIGEFAQGNVSTLASPTFVSGLEIMAHAAANNIGVLGWAWDDNVGGGDAWFPQVYTASGYSTSNSADLTNWGKMLLLDPVYGLQNFAVKASAGSFS